MWDRLNIYFLSIPAAKMDITDVDILCCKYISKLADSLCYRQAVFARVEVLFL